MKALLIALLLIAAPVSAQQPVQPWADGVSYGTAMINPSIAAVQAWRSPHRGCKLGQLAISEGVGNVAALTLKHFVISARPCVGCLSDGWPSGHSMNAAIGYSSWNPGIGLSFGLLTGGLRHQANRHYWNQIGAGLALGVGAEAVGHLLRCES